ncbi:MAG: hypothetical protein MJA83_14380 [Gammaproteobacteria bacterium]|nr:hypothetical protein [Gammaproteobacteria bacterium]
MDKLAHRGSGRMIDGMVGVQHQRGDSELPAGATGDDELDVLLLGRGLTQQEQAARVMQLPSYRSGHCAQLHSSPSLLTSTSCTSHRQMKLQLTPWLSGM